MPHKIASLATWPLFLSNPLLHSYASHSVYAQVALATPTTRETQETYQGDLHNFRHSGNNPTQLPGPGQQRPSSPDYLNEPFLWAWRTRRAPAHCQVCSLIHWSWPAIYFLIPIPTPPVSSQSAFWAPFQEGSLLHSHPEATGAREQVPLSGPIF